MILSLGALGVVFGDIGTSPLYAISSSFSAGTGLQTTPENVLGVLSLVFWSLIIIVCIKYQLFVLRADNKGEGGILALLALLDPWRTRSRKRSTVLIALGIFGAALLYGDGMLTPAISVLSAVEGLQVGAAVFSRPIIIAITVMILVGLFAFQRSGTSRVGSIFGPVTGIWFAVIGLLGLVWIIREPQVLSAINPIYAMRFVIHHGFADIVVLGAVFLCVTGAEALYADLGHFGRISDQVDLVQLCHAGIAPELFWAGCGHSRQSRQASATTFLQPGTELVPVSTRSAGDRGYDHCIAGGNFWGVLSHEPGDPVWSESASHHHPHVNRRKGADLYTLT